MIRALKSIWELRVRDLNEADDNDKNINDED